MRSARVLNKELSSETVLNIVEQYYIGKIKGIAFLVISYENSEEILSLLGDGDIIKIDDYSVDFLANETLLKISNIIIGACVGKIAEILSDNVVYLPPRYLGGPYNIENLPKELFKPNSYVVMLKTVFKFESRDVNSFLLLVNSYESIQWLKDSIHKFVSRYV